jgi:Arc/MetJ-type ribon-helix-helix transcriptional regulator
MPANQPDPPPLPEEDFLRGPPPTRRRRLPAGILRVSDVRTRLGITSTQLGLLLANGLLRLEIHRHDLGIAEEAVDDLIARAPAAPEQPPPVTTDPLVYELWYDIGMTADARPKEKVAISVPADVMDDVRAAVERGDATSVSAFVTEALRERLQQRTLRDVLDELDAQMGAPSEEDVAWARDALAP